MVRHRNLDPTFKGSNPFIPGTDFSHHLKIERSPAPFIKKFGKSVTPDVATCATLIDTNKSHSHKRFKSR